MVFIFSIEILANIEVMSSISNINRVIKETLVFYVICVAPSNYFYNQRLFILNISLLAHRHIYTCYCGTQMVFIFSIEILANIEVISSIPNINRVIEETLVFYVICVAPSNYFYNQRLFILNISLLAHRHIYMLSWNTNGIYIFNRNFGEHRSYVIDIKHQQSDRGDFGLLCDMCRTI